MPEHSSRIRPLLALALALAGALVMGAAASVSAATTTEGGVAWTVSTVDNDNGTGRGNFTYDAEPGAVIQDAMRVLNTGTEPLPLTVYAADAFTTASGQIDVLVDGTPSEDAGTWVGVDPPSIELLPGQTADVAFTISVPADAAPGDHSAGIVTSLVSSDPSQSLSVDRRLGTRINIRVSGDLLPAADVGSASATYTPSWNPFAPGVLTVSYAFDNAGNTRLTGTESVSTGGPLGLFATTASPTQLPEVIPGSIVEVQRDIPAMSLGWLGGTITIAPEGVGLGAGSVAAVTVDYSTVAIPWTLYALLIVVLAAVLVPVLLVRRRSRRAAAENAAP